MRKSLPQAKNLVRSVIDAVFSDSCILCTRSQLFCTGFPHRPPTFSRTCINAPAVQIVINGFSYVRLCVVQMGFFSNERRDAVHAFTCAFRPNARYVSCNVQPPSCVTRISGHLQREGCVREKKKKMLSIFRISIRLDLTLMHLVEDL